MRGFYFKNFIFFFQEVEKVVIIKFFPKKLPRKREKLKYRLSKHYEQFFFYIFYFSRGKFSYSFIIAIVILIHFYSAFSKTLEATSFSSQSTKKRRPDPLPSLANKLASKKARDTSEQSVSTKHTSKTPSKRSRSRTPTKSQTPKKSKSKTPEKSSKTPKTPKSSKPPKRSKTPEKGGETPTQRRQSLDDSVSEVPGTPQVS